MAYAFPLTVAQFADILPIRELAFDIPEALELSETGGGEVLRADLGTRLWRGTVALGDMTSAETDEVMAMLDVLRRANGAFMFYDVRRPGPRLDPNGAILGAVSPTLMAINANLRDIRLQALPASYGLRRGDYLAFTYGSNPTRYALHRIAQPATANASGQTGWIEVSPSIRPGAVAGTAVSLIKTVPTASSCGSREIVLCRYSLQHAVPLYSLQRAIDPCAIAPPPPVFICQPRGPSRASRLDPRPQPRDRRGRVRHPKIGGACRRFPRRAAHNHMVRIIAVMQSSA
ncbi:hypothetical protein DPM13_09830 [Paracoccus mutanolyticus]|uniref:Uncharacterized protein n=1 Tax=Paracoccus mutanolyticus TaxID=1499308 RepID=A0ABM6WRJ7_9RHOB|nr:hypothetical protein [Paracoccus mutanolyticus]AWX93295.1 hypothetical protein DPM13_09830 [Paracoccus mutanolyticus]